MVNDDTPTSYLPEPTPGMMSPNGAEVNSAFRPSFCATALNRSTSKPTTVLPSVSMNSAGAYVESVPTMILPSDLTAAGTLSASALSTVTGAAEAAGPLAPPVGVLSLFSSPQAVMAIV